MGAGLGGLFSTLGGLGASFFGGSSSPKQLNPVLYNQYGQMNTVDQGAITSRDNLFAQVNQAPFMNGVSNATNAYINSLTNAANSPGLNSAYQYGLGELQGNDLSNPLVTNYANQAYQSQVNQAADAASRMRAQMSRGGMGFSTANQQAQAADMAAGASKGALARSGILSQNEQFERGLQQQAPGIMETALAQQPGYLSQVTGAMYAPLQSQANMTQTLLGQNQIGYPSYQQQPSFMQQLTSGLNLGQGLFGAFGGSGSSAGSGLGFLGSLFGSGAGDAAAGAAGASAAATGMGAADFGLSDVALLAALG